LPCHSHKPDPPFSSLGNVVFENTIACPPRAEMRGDRQTDEMRTVSPIGRNQTRWRRFFREATYSNVARQVSLSDPWGCRSGQARNAAPSPRGDWREAFLKTGAALFPGSGSRCPTGGVAAAVANRCCGPDRLKKRVTKTVAVVRSKRRERGAGVSRSHDATSSKRRPPPRSAAAPRTRGYRLEIAYLSTAHTSTL
jgi:hypothetical protein